MDSLFRRAVCLSSSSLRGPRASRWFALLGASCALALLSDPASAATLTWDANGSGAGVTDGGGAWLSGTTWWNGTSAGAWTANDDAVFGNGGTGGAVTLSGPTSASSITFNSFAGTYTIGSAGQTLTTSSNGITMLAGAGNVTISSPVTLGWQQAWWNHSTGLLAVSGSVTNTSWLAVRGSGSTTISGGIHGSGGFSKADSGVVTLSGSNSYSRGTIISGGQLRISGDASLGNASGTVTFTSSAFLAATANGVTLGSGRAIIIDSGATARFGDILNSADANFTISGTISGSGNLRKTEAGTLTLSAANTYTGTTTVSAGVLRLGVAGALADGSGLAVSGGGFDLNGNNETVAAVTLSSGSVFGAGKLTAATYVLSGGTVAGNLGGGTLTVTGTSALNGTSDATAVNLNAGALTLGSGSRFTSSSVAVTGSSGASLALGGNETFGSLAGGANVALAGNRLSVGGLGTSTSYGGTISGAGGVTKLGAGKLTFTSAQLYTGATIISGGTLALGSAGSFASSREIVVGDAGSSGAVLDLTDKASVVIGVGQTLKGIGTALLGPTTALAVSGTFSPGNSPGLFTYNGGSTTLAGTTMMEIFGTSRGVLGGYDAVNVTNSGLLTFGGSLVFDFSQTFAENDTFLLFQGLSGGSLAGTFNSYSINGTSDYTGLTFAQVGTSNVWRTGQTGAGQALELTYGSNALTLSVVAAVAAVPEPGTLALAGCGLGFIGWKTWRRRNRRHT